MLKKFLTVIEEYALRFGPVYYDPGREISRPRLTVANSNAIDCGISAPDHGTGVEGSATSGKEVRLFAGLVTPLSARAKLSNNNSARMSV